MNQILISLIFLFPPVSQREALLTSGKPQIKPALFPDTLKAFDIQHYLINLNIDPQNAHIQGNVYVSFISLSDTLSTLKLFLSNLTVDSCKKDTQNLPFIYQDSTLLIDLLGTIPRGTTTIVSVFYQGYPGPGFYFYPNIFFTFTEPYRTKNWLPNYDDPSEKSLVDIKAYVDSGYYLVANGNLVDSSFTGSTWMYHWKESYPIAPYLISIAGSPDYIVLRDTFIWSQDTMPILNVVFSEDSTLALDKFQRTPLMLTYFSNTFGLYPFIDEKYGHIHALLGGAMEHQTNTFINVHLNWGNDWDWVVAHELAHHWFGDWVTCKTWKDIWLNEGFATYSEALWFGNRDGEPAYHSYIAGVMNAAVQNEPDPPFSLYDPDYLFYYAVVYLKGASVLHMLRHILGDFHFFQGLRTYLQRYSYQSATTENLRNTLEEISGKDLWWFFQEWVYLPGHPVYQFTWSFDSIAPYSYEIYLNVNQVQSHDYGVPTYKMPVDIWVITERGDTLSYIVWDSLDSQDFVLQSSQKPAQLLFDPENWIMKEIQPFGISEKKGQQTLPVSILFKNSEVVLYLSQKSPVYISLYDVSGRRRIALVNGILSKGMYNLRIPEKLKSGIYFLSGDINGYNIKKKGLILR